MGGGGNALACERLEQFPHADAIERSTGMAIPGTAFLDPAAWEARGVAAFTDGTETFFADPDLKVAAHEASHQLQHTGGAVHRNRG